MPLPIHRDDAMSNTLKFLSKILVRHAATRLNPRNGIRVGSQPLCRSPHIRTVSVAHKLEIFLQQYKEDLLTIAQAYFATSEPPHRRLSSPSLCNVLEVLYSILDFPVSDKWIKCDHFDVISFCQFGIQNL
jgi:hypothetical protein